MITGKVSRPERLEVDISNLLSQEMNEKLSDNDNRDKLSNRE
jgi:hypothetical protein